MINRIVPLSGGKDSQATLIWAVEKFGASKVQAVFCDTEWENPITYEHIFYLCEKLNVELTILTNKKTGGFVELCKKKKRFPSVKARFCTSELKVKPMIDYILSLKSHVFIYQGIRADESLDRSLMKEQCTYFKYYFQPYQTNTKIINKYTKIAEKQKLSPLQQQKLSIAKKRLSEGKEDEKYHTYRKKDVIEWRKKYSDDIVRPFFRASSDDVIRFSLNRELDINPLYFKGFSRVGCFPCIMCTVNEMDIIIKEYPEIIAKIKQAEEAVKGTFFKPDKVPERYRTNTDPKSGKKITSIDDFVKYRLDKNATGDLFADDEQLNGCKSVYHICE